MGGAGVCGEGGARAPGALCRGDEPLPFNLSLLAPLPPPQVVISCSRLDVRYAVLKPAFNPDKTVGVYLVTPEKGADGLAGRRNAVRSDADVSGGGVWVECGGGVGV